ncbi:hypothetical protein EWM64_g6074 [Hericium alpestre]|uniref:F-box domain-containing protein n=1 Tax=Hericium alpestre TaxID=135208 RepID=A0A4Y9ZSS2_9AGAM|nr:hypothetical protein EWM64_g6074 [Hericium alpestre]
MIAEHTSHIRHLSVGGVASDLIRNFTKLASPTDCLESLRVSAVVMHHAERLILSDELRDVFPHLRRIELQEVPMHWSSPILCGLTHLKLAFDDPGFNSDWWFSKSQSSGTTTLYGLFFSALERMPALEVLDLKNALPSRDGGSHEDRLVALSLLRKLELEDETVRCLDILKQLKFPPSCHLTLICNEPTGVERIADIFPVLRDYARDGDMPPPAILTLAVERDYFQLDIERNHDLLAHAPDFDFYETTADISLRIPYPEDPTVDRAVAFQALCEVFPLEHLRVFSLRHRYDVNFQWSRERWIEIFGRCRAVEHVHVMRTAATLISALAHPIPRSAAEQDTQQGSGYRLFLENLKTLTFKDVNFEGEFGDGHEPETLSEVALKLFASRKQIKALPTMHISADCNIATAVREELEKMFKVVRLPRPEYGELWDGISSSDSDDSYPIYSHGDSSAGSSSD